ncbi:MAG: class I SAM-dependent methyltransferase [Candidatus Eisenbacteria bacterium]
MNVYDDDERARAYDQLEFPGTYFLAFRDLPGLFRKHVRGTRALDFGCGAGRSSRFLRDLGFSVVGIDISHPMLAKARERDPEGDYRRVEPGDPRSLPGGPFDLILSAFTFDNLGAEEEKEATLRALRSLLGAGGRLVSVVSAPEIYVHEWASFSTRDFPENRQARSGDRVKIVMLDVPDRRPVEDIVCTDDTYARIYDRVGLTVLETVRPLFTGEEPFAWQTETEVAAWVVYVLGLASEGAARDDASPGRVIE